MMCVPFAHRVGVAELSMYGYIYITAVAGTCGVKQSWSEVIEYCLPPLQKWKAELRQCSFNGKANVIRMRSDQTWKRVIIREGIHQVSPWCSLLKGQGRKGHFDLSIHISSYLKISPNITHHIFSAFLPLWPLSYHAPFTPSNCPYYLDICYTHSKKFVLQLEHFPAYLSLYSFHSHYISSLFDSPPSIFSRCSRKVSFINSNKEPNMS